MTVRGPAAPTATGGQAQKIMRLVKAHKKFKSDVARREEKLKEMKAARDKSEIKLYEYLEDNDLKAVKLGDGTSVTRTDKLFGGCNKEFHPDLKKWFAQNDILGEGFREEINKSILNKLVRDFSKEGREGEIPECITFWVKKSVTIRG